MNNRSNNTMFASRAIGAAKMTSIALAAISAILMAPAAKSQTFTLLSDQSESQSVWLSENSGGVYNSSIAGRFKGVLAGPVFNTFCNDLFHNINFGQSFTAGISYKVSDAAGALSNNSGGYYQGGLASGLTNTDYITTGGNPTAAQAQVRSAASAWILDTYGNTINFTGLGTGSSNLVDNTTAMQIAIWDLVQDGGDGVSAGTVRLDTALHGQATSDNAKFSPMVNFFESAALAAANAVGGYKGRAYFIVAPTTNSAGTFTHLQNFSAAVPEPGEMTMILGVGMMGVAGIYRKRKVSRK